MECLFIKECRIWIYTIELYYKLYNYNNSMYLHNRIIQIVRKNI